MRSFSRPNGHHATLAGARNVEKTRYFWTIPLPNLETHGFPTTLRVCLPLQETPVSRPLPTAEGCSLRSHSLGRNLSRLKARRRSLWSGHRLTASRARVRTRSGVRFLSTRYSSIALSETCFASPLGRQRPRTFFIAVAPKNFSALVLRPALLSGYPVKPFDS